MRAPVALGLAPRLLASASVASLAAHVPRNLHPSELAALAPGRELLRLDLHRSRPDEPLPLARARFRVRDGRFVGGIAVWVEMGLAPGVRLSTRAGTHWLPTLLPVDPLPAGPGRLDVEIDWNPARRRWSLRFEGDRGARCAATHAPLFAWGAVFPAIRHRGRR